MTPAKMFDGDLWVLASDVMQLAENAYKNGQTDEREACAKVCERGWNEYCAEPSGYALAVKECSAAIRARGNT